MPKAHEKLTERRKLLVEGLANGDDVAEIAARSRTPERVVSVITKAISISLAANDTDVDDFLDYVEGYFNSDLKVFAFSNPGVREERELITDSDSDALFSTKKQSVLDALERDWSPKDLRDLGGSLLRLGDAIDQAWSPYENKREYHWPSKAASIERDSFNLAQKAARLLEERRNREAHFSPRRFEGPAWNMLLELFCQFAGGAKISSKSLVLSSGSPASTAMRHIDKLENEGMIKRIQSEVDGRVTLVGLTKRGVLSVGSYLQNLRI